MQILISLVCSNLGGAEGSPCISQVSVVVSRGCGNALGPILPRRGLPEEEEGDGLRFPAAVWDLRWAAGAGVLHRASHSCSAPRPFFFFPLDFGVSPCLFFLNDALPGPTRSPRAAGPLRDRAGSSRPGLDGPVSLCPDQASARGPARR